MLESRKHVGVDEEKMKSVMAKSSKSCKSRRQERREAVEIRELSKEGTSEFEDARMLHQITSVYPVT